MPWFGPSSLKYRAPSPFFRNKKCLRIGNGVADGITKTIVDMCRQKVESSGDMIPGFFKNNQKGNRAGEYGRFFQNFLCNIRWLLRDKGGPAGQFYPQPLDLKKALPPLHKEKLGPK